MDREPIFSVLRWVGGKKRLLPQISKYTPDKIASYHEPFLGGGALAFALAHQNARLSDYNSELINFYQTLASHPDELLSGYRQLSNDENTYYEVRNADKTPDFKNWTAERRAIRFLYLNKHCFNGIWRVNAKHGYNNVPYAFPKNPKIDEDNFFALSRYLSKITLSAGDFGLVEQRASPGDFVYCDPPYIPISQTESFVGYTMDGFGWSEQVRLRDMALRLREKDVKVLISNSCCDLSLDLYKDFNIHRFPVSRTVGAQSHSRKKVEELLAANF